MITYPVEMVTNAIKEVCGKFAMTRNIVIKEVRFDRDLDHYLVTLGDSTIHAVPKEMINKYIESLGDKCDYAIGACLIHSTELEESARSSNKPNIDEYWDGDINEVYKYLDKRFKAKGDEDIEKGSA